MAKNEAEFVEEQLERLLRDQPTGDGPAAGKRLAFLAAASQLFDESLDYASTLAHVARVALPLLGDLCIVDMVDAEGRARCVDTAHVVPERDAHLAQFRGREPSADGFRTRVLRSGQPLLVAEIDDAAADTLLVSLHTRGFRSLIIVPLIAHKVTFGVLTLAITEQDRRFTLADMNLARQLADRAALAMDNARLLAEERKARSLAERTAHHLTRMQAVTAALSVATTRAQVARVVLGEGASLLEADVGIFTVMAEGGAAVEIVSSFGLEPRPSDGTRLQLSASCSLTDAVRDGRPAFLDVRSGASCLPGVGCFVGGGVGGLAVVPLQVGGRMLGAFQFCFRHERRPHDCDREFLLALGESVAQCLDRVRLSESAMESERRFRSLADTLPQQIWIHAWPGKVEYFNKRALEYLGLTLEEGLTLDQLSFIERFMHPDDQARAREGLETSFRNGTIFDVEVRRRRADGIYRWHICRAVPIRDEQGNVVRWFGTATDIEAQKRTEAALEQGRVFRERLVGIIGHDLRDPLGALVMAMQILTKGARTPAETLVLERMHRSLQRMTRMVVALLDFARSREGVAFPITRQRLDIVTLCREVLDELSLAHPGRQLTLEAPGPAPGAWDGDRLAQVVSNLVSNAIHHGDRGQPVLVRVTDEPTAVCLDVHNRGVIPPEDLAGMFDPYRTASRPPGARRDQNAGLGLYIVREIVLAHGGTVEARSTATEGTVFSVRLPRA
jgi:PAS domain S-box-containing protein